MQKKGQLFTMDLLLALVPMALVLGVSANAMSGVVTQMQDYVHVYSMNRIANDAADILVKTAGDPVDWNSTNSPDVVGLAKYEDGAVVPHFLDDAKVGQFSSTYLGDLLGPSFSYYNLTMEGIGVEFFRSWGGGSSSSASDIMVAKRVARLEVGKIMGGFFEVSHKGSEVTEPCYGKEGQPRVYSSSFTVTAADLADYDFWIVRYGRVTDWYEIWPDDPLVQCTTGANAPDHSYGSSGENIVKEQIDDGPGLGPQLQAGSNTVYIRIAGSVHRTADYYILRVPAGTAENSVSAALAKPNPIMLNLEVGR